MDPRRRDANGPSRSADRAPAERVLSALESIAASLAVLAAERRRERPASLSPDVIRECAKAVARMLGSR